MREKTLSKKSLDYILHLRNTKGFDYANLVAEECKNIIDSNTNMTGYCFSEQQLHDITQICLFEKVEIESIITYDDIDTKRISYITIIKKHDIFQKKLPKRCYQRKTNLKKNRKSGTDLQKSYEQNNEKTMEEIKQNILEHYNFI